MKRGITLLFFTTFFMSSSLLMSQNQTFKSKFNFFKLPEGVSMSDVMENTVIFKLRDQHRNNAFNNYLEIPAVNNLLSQLQGQNLRKKFPNAKRPERERNHLGYKYADLSLIYEFDYTASADLIEVINEFLGLGYFEYVEPHYIRKTFYTPNDPSFSQQYHHNNIRSQQAWNFTKGNANTTVAIVDSGTDPNHPDLQGNWKYNTNDPIDGTDNDFDGYVDNYAGWDFVGNDGDPDCESSNSDHGVHVAGCAAATTDNGVGVAGPGFDCSVLHIRAGSGTTISFGYEGIAYAADFGVDVINCSWGGAGSSSVEQDAITYASINQDVLVVVSAGNGGDQVKQYPAAYDHVLSVVNTNQSDAKSSSSTYGDWVEICAPGNQILATTYNSTYSFYSGTSMASPIVAGGAALVKSNYNFLTAKQLGAQLKISADNIDGVNPAYAGKLGHGRLNLENCFTGFFSQPFMEMTNHIETDNNDDAFVANDTVRISTEWANHLANTGNVTATITTSSPWVNILNNTTNFGVVSTNSSVDNYNAPWEVVVNSGTPLNSSVTFVITLDDGTYSWTENLTFTVNVDYVNIGINEVATTITSKGIIGFNDFSTQLEGLGFIYPYPSGSNLLFDGGVMIGDPTRVSDHVRSTGGAVDADFISSDNVNRIANVMSEYDVEGVFNDVPAAQSLGVDVVHHGYAWTLPGHRKYVMVEYDITNTSSTTLNDVYCGIFCDWDITVYSENKAATDQARKLGYCYHNNNNGFYAGTQLLTSNAPFIHYAVDHVTGGGGGLDLSDGYTTQEKYTSMSVNRLSAGGNGIGNDVFNVVSSGPFTIAPGDTVTVAFALLGGDDLADLQASADSAWSMYNGELLDNINENDSRSFNLIKSVYPNPASDVLNIDFENNRNSENYNVSIVDVQGKTVLVSNENAVFSGNQVVIDIETLAPGTYLLKVEDLKSNFTETINFQKVK
ncbi:MAG: S8 family peptidase [Flavobacteriales bacterium]|nr:S8 family peptidase [Flavobacteriales bacterium]